MYEIVGSGVGCRVAGAAVGDGLGDGDGDGVGAAVVISTVGVGVGEATTTGGVPERRSVPRSRIARGVRTIATCRVVGRRIVLG